MAKSNTASKILPTQAEVVDKVNSLQIRGVEISIMIEEIDFKRNVTLKKWFSVDSSIDGYGYKLGKLLSDLRKVNPEAKQIPQELLKECSLDKIDRRRRSEWEWFYNHQSELDEFFLELAKARKCSKMAVRQNFSSVTALKRAYVEATQKPSNEELMKKCIDCGEKLIKDVNWTHSRYNNWVYVCKYCCSDRGNKDRMWVNNVYIPTSHPDWKPGRYDDWSDVAFSKMKVYNKRSEGDVYVITNPAWKNWYKIGKAVDAKDRVAQLNTASPFRDFEVIKIFTSDDRNRAEVLAHRAAEKICVEKRHEWFYTENVDELIEGITP